MNHIFLSAEDGQRYGGGEYVLWILMIATNIAAHPKPLLFADSQRMTATLKEIKVREEHLKMLKYLHSEAKNLAVPKLTFNRVCFTPLFFFFFF